MEKAEEQALKIIQILPEWKFEDIKRVLLSLPDDEFRVSRALLRYLRRLPIVRIEQQARHIQTLFPGKDMDEIRNDLQRCLKPDRLRGVLLEYAEQDERRRRAQTRVAKKLSQRPDNRVQLFNYVATFIPDLSWEVFLEKCTADNINVQSSDMSQVHINELVLDLTILNTQHKNRAEAESWSNDIEKAGCSTEVPVIAEPIIVEDTSDPEDMVVQEEVVVCDVDVPDSPKMERPATPSLEGNEPDPDQLANLQKILPNADPEFLKFNADTLSPTELEEFINELLETGNYPTMKDYVRKQQLSSQQRQYTTEFNVDNFLKVIPDPCVFFETANTRSTKEDRYYSLIFLRNHFPKCRLQDITKVYSAHSAEPLMKICQHLDSLPNSMKTKRKLTPVPLCSNIPLLQEIAFLSHKDEICHVLEQNAKAKEAARIVAKSRGLIITCSCCFDDEVLPEDSACCESNHQFCKQCVKTGVTMKFSEGMIEFTCLADCEDKFSLKTLQAVLEPKVFSKIALKQQIQEIKAAGIEDLESCPFCDFATITPPENRIFRCLNEDCMKESCRECKEPSHIPLRCEEVEKNEEIKKRTYIENKMTEAMTRTCWRCEKKFVKSDGCNKMTCLCGAKMCYVCNAPVTDYTHFNGQGGSNFQLCPLYSDSNEQHVRDALQAANAAKEDVGLASTSQLTHDPTRDLVLMPERPPPARHGRYQARVRGRVRRRYGRVRFNIPENPEMFAANFPIHLVNIGFPVNLAANPANMGFPFDVPANPGNIGFPNNVPANPGNVGFPNNAPAIPGNIGFPANVPANPGNMGLPVNGPADLVNRGFRAATIEFLNNFIRP